MTFSVYIYIYIYRERERETLFLAIKKCIYIYIYRERERETLFLAIKKCTSSTTDVIWVNSKVCSVASEPTQSSSRRVSALKNSSVVLTT